MMAASWPAWGEKSGLVMVKSFRFPWTGMAEVMVFTSSPAWL